MPAKRQGLRTIGARALLGVLVVGAACCCGPLRAQPPAIERAQDAGRDWIPANNDPHKRACIRAGAENSPAPPAAWYANATVPGSPYPVPAYEDSTKRATVPVRYDAPGATSGALPSSAAPAAAAPQRMPATSPSPQLVSEPVAFVSPPPHPLAGPYGAPGDGPVPQELAKVSLPPYVIEPPDVLLIESTQSLRDQPVRGQHLVRPDGTIGLGIYGCVHVGGLTLEQAQAAVAQQLASRINDLDVRNLYVDVLAYNSKFYYVVTDGGGYGEQVYRFPVTGNETVFDAIALIGGLPPVASKKQIWVARRSGGEGGCEQLLPVDWVGISQHGSTATNYQIFPGDRIYVKADHWIRADNWLAKRLAPVERVLGVTLLGSTTVNSIQRRGTTTVP